MIVQINGRVIRGLEVALYVKLERIERSENHHY